MSSGHQPCDDAQADVNDECTADRHTPDQVVQAVCGENQVAEGPMLIDWAMTVMPVQKLLEDMEGEHSSRDPYEDRHVVAEHRDRFRQHVEQRTAQKCAGGQCHQRHHNAGEQPLRHEQRATAGQSQGAHGHPRHHDPGQN